MAKRFTDTEKYKKKFVRSLQGAYKLLWDYLYHDCNHAGIWHIDFEIAQIYLGKDMPVNKEDALKFFNKGKERIIELKNGKWFILAFVKFQYGTLNPANKVHNSVINELIKCDVNKGLVSTLQGSKDKYKDKDKIKDKDKYTLEFENFWKIYPKKNGKLNTFNLWKKLTKNEQAEIMVDIPKRLNDDKWVNGFIKDPERYIKNRQWEDEIKKVEKLKVVNL